MKKKITKIWGVGLTLVLATTMLLFPMPVSAAIIDLAVNDENPWMSKAFTFTGVSPGEDLAPFPVKFRNVGSDEGVLTFSMSYVENDMAGTPAPNMDADEFASLVYVEAVTHQYFGGSYPEGGGIHDDLPNWEAMDLNVDGKVSLYELMSCSPIPWATAESDTLPAGEASEFVITFCLGNSLDGGAGGAILPDVDNASQGDGISVTVSATLGTDTEESSGNVFQAAGVAGPVLNNTTDVTYGTIQVAIDDAGSGDTINVATGTYVEDLSIDATKTGLMLVGNGATIKGVAMTPWDEFPTVAPNINILADDVSISGFTIRGIDVTPGYYSSGICIGGSNVEIFNNDFEVTNAGSMDDIGQAIQTYNKLAIPGVDISGLNIHDNTFTSYGEGDIGFEGIYINRDEGTGSISITGNTFTGDIFRGITSERSNTAISGNSLITEVSSDVCWQGVLVRDASGAQDNVSVVSNIISGFSDGIRVGTDGQVLTNISVVGNSVSGCVKAIRVLTAEDITIAENTVSGTIGGSDSVAILVESTESVAILANIVSDFEKGGIVVKDTLAIQIEGNTVSNISYGLAPNGIQVGYVMDYTLTGGNITDNRVSGCKWEGYDPTKSYEYWEEGEGGFKNWTGSGILVIAPNSGLTISGNEVQDNDVGLDIEAGSGTSATGNDVHDNSYGFVLWNADPTINLNSIYQNALGGVYRTTAGETDGSLDATNNWWGHSSGPSGVGSGLGDTVSSNVDYAPWLLTEGGDPFDVAVLLPTGWGIVSPDREITDWYAVNSVGLVLTYDAAEGAFVEAIGMDAVTPAFIKTTSDGWIGFNYAESTQGIFTTDLEVGWNLIGVPETNAETGAILSPLEYGTGSEIALATLASQGGYNPSEADSFYRSMTGTWSELPTLYPFDGYWAYMNVAKEFGVIVVE